LFAQARLLRKPAPPGSLLLVFGLTWPVAKIGLEQVRAISRPAGLMLGIAAGIMAIAVAVLVAVAWRYRVLEVTRVRWVRRATWEERYGR
jgi:hypothetical protein